MDGLQESREVRFTPAWLTSLLQPVSSSVTWDLKGTSHRDTGGGSKLAQATGPSVLQVWTKPRIPVSLLGHGWPRAELEAGLVLLASSGLAAFTCNPFGIFESEGRRGCLGPKDKALVPQLCHFCRPGSSTRWVYSAITYHSIGREV